MDSEKLKKGKQLEALINYHDGQHKGFESKITDLRGYLSSDVLQENTDFEFNVEEGKGSIIEDGNGEKRVMIDYFSLKRSGYTGMHINFRPKALITYLEIEKQYHYQEMKKFERELKRL